MGWNDNWLNKRVFIQLKKGDCYTGNIISIDETFIIIIDKYNEKVGLAISEISKIKEENGNDGGGKRW